MSRPVTTEDILLYILAIFVPPIPVFIRRGCGGQVWLNILLCFLGGIPGLIHACYIIYKGPKVGSEYVYHDPNLQGHYQHSAPPPPHPSHSYSQAPPPPPPNQSYAQPPVQGHYKA